MGQETEAKFYVLHPEKVQLRLEELGAPLKAPRVLETNLRFDTSRGELGSAHKVLRLRHDTRSRLTYKDASVENAGALSRRELEFTVSSFDEARQFLEALGYKVIFIYEKYRTTYELDGLEIVLDELPYGHFVEIEGNDASLESAARKLGLRWETAVGGSYSALFDSLQVRRRLQFRDLTFENFAGQQVSAGDLGLQPADE